MKFKKAYAAALTSKNPEDVIICLNAMKGITIEERDDDFYKVLFSLSDALAAKTGCDNVADVLLDFIPATEADDGRRKQFYKRIKHYADQEKNPMEAALSYAKLATRKSGDGRVHEKSFEKVFAQLDRALNLGVNPADVYDYAHDFVETLIEEHAPKIFIQKAREKTLSYLFTRRDALGVSVDFTTFFTELDDDKDSGLALRQEAIEGFGDYLKTWNSDHDVIKSCFLLTYKHRNTGRFTEKEDADLRKGFWSALKHVHDAFFIDTADFLLKDEETRDMPDLRKEAAHKLYDRLSRVPEIVRAPLDYVQTLEAFDARLGVRLECEARARAGSAPAVPSRKAIKKLAANLAA